MPCLLDLAPLIHMSLGTLASLTLLMTVIVRVIVLLTSNEAPHSTQDRIVPAALRVCDTLHLSYAREAAFYTSLWVALAAYQY